jgi:predicted DCC family thiol-disulfide oxidoreductase YuxK
MQQQQRSNVPGGWTKWQTLGYRVVVAIGLLIWVFTGRYTWWQIGSLLALCDLVTRPGWIGQIIALASVVALVVSGLWPWLIVLAAPAILTPSLIKGRAAAKGPEMLYYDGHCGLCHNVIKFVLDEDPDGTSFRFAPLDSDSFRSSVPEDVRRTLPDSVVIWTQDRKALCKSSAVLHMLHRLGGYWRILADRASRHRL